MSNSPMAFMYLAKVAQNWHIHLTSRAFGHCKQKGEGSGEKSYEKELPRPTLKGYLLEIRKVSPKPHFTLMTAFTLSVEYARFINMIYV